MSYKMLFFVLSFLCSNLIFSQDSKTEDELLREANTYYTSAKYSDAAKAFYNLYNFNNEGIYLYYAASSAVNDKNYKLALTYYLQLRNLKYTGIETQYLATNKKTNKEEIMSLGVRDSLVRIGEYKKPKKRKTASKIPEITKNIALIYIEQGQHDKALLAVKQALKEDPKNLELALAEANIQYALGNISTFESIIKRLSKKDKKNDDLLYNLGVLSADKGNEKLAEKYYKKAIKLNPNNTNAFINLAALILSKELPLIEEMNNLGVSIKDDKRYNKLLKERDNIYRQAMPYLEKALKLSPNNKELATTLKNLYESLGLTEKEKTLKEKL